MTEQSLGPAVQLERHKRRLRMAKAMELQGGGGAPAAGAGRTRGGAAGTSRDAVYDVDDV